MGLLLIDDDGDFRSGLAENLRDDGHRVYEYSVPCEVPPFATLGKVSLLIMDYQFSDDDGIRFSDRVHDTHPTLPVVILTAYRSDHLEAATARREYLHVLRKPLDYDTLHALVHRLIGAPTGPPPHMRTT